MRIATFNLESLDLPPKAHVPLEVRAEVLRPALARLEADVLCLQEVNGQPVRGQAERELIALDQLLAGTPYADYHRVSTTGPDGHGVADVHNLVTLSRLPLLATREVRHSLYGHGVADVHNLAMLSRLPLLYWRHARCATASYRPCSILCRPPSQPTPTISLCALIEPYSSRILMLAADGASLSLICTFVRPWRPPSPVRSSRLSSEECLGVGRGLLPGRRSARGTGPRTAPSHR